MVQNFNILQQIMVIIIWWHHVSNTISSKHNFRYFEYTSHKLAQRFAQVHM